MQARAGELVLAMNRVVPAPTRVLTGVVREADPGRRLAYTFVWEDPDPDDVETVVDLRFRPIAGATEVTHSRGPFKTEARRALHRDGWTDSFDKLERLVTEKT